MPIIEAGIATHEPPPFKEVPENTLQVRAIAPTDFHLRGRGMQRFLRDITEIAGMEDFTVPVVLDPTNSEASPFSAKHPLGGRKKARDENGFLGWRDSWISACVYNGTRDQNGVQVTVTAHTCGDIRTDKILRAIYTSVHPARMQWGLLSSAGQTTDFRDYELAGDPFFKEIVAMLWQNPKTRQEKTALGQSLETAVLARKALGRELAEQGTVLEQLDTLLLKGELRKLQKIFGDYEGILERTIAKRIIEQRDGLQAFPYINRYDQLTDTEITGTEMTEGVRNVCMVGGGWFPISAVFYALKTNAHIFVVEKDPQRVAISTKVIQRLGLSERITVLNQKAEEVDYGRMDVVVLAAMAEPKDRILQQAALTNFPRTIAVRGLIGDSKAFYPGFTPQELFGRINRPFHYYPERYEIQAEGDSIFSLLYLDAERVVDFP